MTKRRKDILKRKYIAPEVYFEQTEPWEMIAATAGAESGNMGGGGNGDGGEDMFEAKYNPFFDEYSEDFEDELDYEE